MLKLNCSVSEIVCRLAADFNEVPERQIADDVAGFIVDLERKGLLAPEQPGMRTGLLERLLVMAVQGCEECDSNQKESPRLPALEGSRGPARI